MKLVLFCPWHIYTIISVVRYVVLLNGSSACFAQLPLQMCTVLFYVKSWKGDELVSEWYKVLHTIDDAWLLPMD
jgi:hypothetical protein